MIAFLNDWLVQTRATHPTDSEHLTAVAGRSSGDIPAHWPRQV